ALADPEIGLRAHAEPGVALPFHQELVAERRQGGLVERLAAHHVADAHTRMVDHGSSRADQAPAGRPARWPLTASPADFQLLCACTDPAKRSPLSGSQQIDGRAALLPKPRYPLLGCGMRRQPTP